MIYVDFIPKSIELQEPGLTDRLTRHCCLKGILSQLSVLMFIIENSDGALHRIDEIFSVIWLESKTTTNFTVELKFDHRIFKTSSFEGDYRCAPYEEFMLHNTTGFEKTRHQTEVRASVHECSVHEKFFGSGPERIRVLCFKVPHPCCTLCWVRVSHVGRSPDQELNISLISFDNFLSNI